MRNLSELLLNPARLDFETEIIEVVRGLDSKVNSDDKTGLCKLFCSQIKSELSKKHIRTEIIDQEIFGINHQALIAKDGKNTFLIDPTYIQFCKRDGFKMINDQPFFDQNLNNHQIAEELVSKGYVKVSEEDLEDYINSFKANY